jgi:hypothetical protein
MAISKVAGDIGTLGKHLDQLHETYRIKLSDLMLRSPAKLGVSKDGNWNGRRPRPSFETHRWCLSSGARPRDPLAMLLIRK